MNLFGLSPGELLLIMVVAMIVLGPEKLPEVAASAGKWIAEFRRATQELSRQFAEDNPFAEIQRALNFEEPPASTETVTTTEEAAAEQPPVTAESSTMVASPPLATVPTAAPSRFPARVASDYFARPASYVAIADEWAHGSLANGVAHDPSARWQAVSPLDAEWTLGVPIVVEPPVSAPVAPGEEDLFNTIATASSEVEAPDLATTANGTSDAAGESTIPGIPAGATLVEPAPEEIAEAAVADADSDATIDEGGEADPHPNPLPEGEGTGPTLPEGEGTGSATREGEGTTPAVNGVVAHPTEVGKPAPTAVGAGDRSSGDGEPAR